MTDDPLDHRISREDAARLLLGATDAANTGVTILGGADASPGSQKFAGRRLRTYRKSGS